MKRKAVLIIFIIFNLSYVFSQNQSSNVAETTTTTSKSCTTTDKDWSWNNNQWYYKGKPVSTFPPNYTETEKKKETITYKNGKIVKSCNKIILEVKTKYETSLPDWTWSKGQWFYKGKAASTSPAT